MKLNVKTKTAWHPFLLWLDLDGELSIWVLRSEYDIQPRPKAPSVTSQTPVGNSILRLHSTPCFAFAGSRTSAQTAYNTSSTGRNRFREGAFGTMELAESTVLLRSPTGPSGSPSSALAQLASMQLAD
jgi:hypothetical protein